MNITNKYAFLSGFLLFWLSNALVPAQNTDPVIKGKRGDIRIMFYNVENFFDTYDDSLTADNEFLPESEKEWNYFRYKEKTINLFKTIAAVGEVLPPEIICFAEIENYNVLYEIANNTPLEKYDYEIVHFDSPDIRGIDVGLLFRRNIISKLEAKRIPVLFPFNSNQTSRDILYFKALMLKSDTVHLFVNHWPSRRGGEILTAPYRKEVAQILKTRTDSILKSNPCANIIITGDFNDEPSNESLTEGLNALTEIHSTTCLSLYNLSGRLQNLCKCGSYRYKSDWNMFDQFIVSGNLLTDRDGMKTCVDCLQIAKFDFLLIEDKKYGGYKPYRTYQGPVYKGGFSDHLPVYLDLF